MKFHFLFPLLFCCRILVVYSLQGKLGNVIKLKTEIKEQTHLGTNAKKQPEYSERRQDDFLEYDAYDGLKIGPDNFNNPHLATVYREDLDKYLTKNEYHYGGKIYNDENAHGNHLNGDENASGNRAHSNDDDNFRYDTDPSFADLDRIRSLPLRSKAAQDTQQIQEYHPLHVFDPYASGNEFQNEVLSRPGIAKTRPNKRKRGKKKLNKNARSGVPDRREFRPDEYSHNQAAYLNFYGHHPPPQHVTTISPPIQHHSTADPFLSGPTTRRPKQFFETGPTVPTFISTTPAPGGLPQSGAPLFRSSPFVSTPSPEFVRATTPSTSFVHSSTEHFHFSTTRNPSFFPSSPIGHHHDQPHHSSLAHITDDDPFVPISHPHVFSTTSHPQIQLDSNPIHPHPFTTTHMPKHHLSNAGNIETFHTTLQPIHVHQDSNAGQFHRVTTPAPIVSSLPPRKKVPHLIHETVYSTTTTRIPTIHTTHHQTRPSNIYDAISSLPQGPILHQPTPDPLVHHRGTLLPPVLSTAIPFSSNVQVLEDFEEPYHQVNQHPTLAPAHVTNLRPHHVTTLRPQHVTTLRPHHVTTLRPHHVTPTAHLHSTGHTLAPIQLHPDGHTGNTFVKMLPQRHKSPTESINYGTTPVKGVEFGYSIGVDHGNGYSYQTRTGFDVVG